MDALALLCNLFAEGPETLRRLRGAGAESLEDLGELRFSTLEAALGRGDAAAQRFLREARELAVRLGVPGPNPTLDPPMPSAGAGSKWPSGLPPTTESDSRAAVEPDPASDVDHAPGGWSQPSLAPSESQKWGIDVPVSAPVDLPEGPAGQQGGSSGSSESGEVPGSLELHPVEPADSASSPDTSSPAEDPLAQVEVPRPLTGRESGASGWTSGEPDDAEDTALTEPEVGSKSNTGGQSVLSALLRAWQKSESGRAPSSAAAAPQQATAPAEAPETAGPAEPREAAPAGGTPLSAMSTDAPGARPSSSSSAAGWPTSRRWCAPMHRS